MLTLKIIGSVSWIAISIFCFYFVLRNIIILPYTINDQNISQENKIHKVDELVVGGCVSLFHGIASLSCFIVFAHIPALFLMPILFVLQIISFLLYINRSYIHNFLVRRFILHIKKDSLPLWKWIPNIRLNDLYFDKSPTEFDTVVLKKYYTYYTSKTDDNEENQVIYHSIIDDSFLKFTEKTHVFVNADISSNLYYQGHNLIGLTLKELEKILNIDDLERSTVGNYNEFKKLNKLEEVLNIENFKVINNGFYTDCYESKKLNAKFIIDQKVEYISVYN